MEQTTKYCKSKDIDKIGQYLRRGQLPKYFMTKLPCFKHIIKISREKNSELDIQYRGGYINVYYKGGNLLKLSRQDTVELDEKYFHTPEENGWRSTHIEIWRKNKKDINERREFKDLTPLEKKSRHNDAEDIYKALCDKRDEVVNKLRQATTEQETRIVLKKIMKQIDDWKECLKQNGWRKSTKNERSVQHYISLNNKDFDEGCDFLVLDIEYAISSLAKYKKDGVEKDSEQPRLDIIAIDRDGQLYVMELKYGMKSVNNESGIKPHIEDYYATVGNDSKWQDFNNDVSILLKRKQIDNLIPDNLTIANKKPKFAFILKIDKDSDEKMFQDKLKENGLCDIPTIYLPKDNTKEYPSKNYVLSKNLIKLCK